MLVSRHVKFAGLLVVALVGVGAGASAVVVSGSIPHIRQFEYTEDYDNSGHHYTMSATIKGEAGVVKARAGSVSAKGKLTNAADTDPRGKVWVFRVKPFVKRLRADLYADGFATVIVKARNGAIKRKKICELNLELDPQFGDYASGDCDRI